MSEQELFVLADKSLKSVIDQIQDSQWDMEMPPSFARGKGQDKITLREVVNYHAYDDAWVPDTLSGKTMEEAGKDKFDGDLLGSDPKTSFADLVDAACIAATALDDPERTVHLTYGDFPAKDYLSHITSFRGLRVHDIAQVIGSNTEMPADLVQGLWDMLKPHMEEWRAMGVFGPEVKIPESASLQDRLLGMTGRQPDHKG